MVTVPSTFTLVYTFSPLIWERFFNLPDIFSQLGGSTSKRNRLPKILLVSSYNSPAYHDSTGETHLGNQVIDRGFSEKGGDGQGMGVADLSPIQFWKLSATAAT